MSIPIVNLADHIQGDTWPGIPVIGPILINGAQPGAAAARVQLSFTRINTATRVVVSFDSQSETGTFPINIVDAATWEFEIPEVDYGDFTVTAGKYEGHLIITDVLGKRITTHDVRMKVERRK